MCSETRRLGSPPGKETPALAANRGFSKLKNPPESYSVAGSSANGNLESYKRRTKEGGCTR